MALSSSLGRRGDMELRQVRLLILVVSSLALVQLGHGSNYDYDIHRYEPGANSPYQHPSSSSPYQNSPYDTQRQFNPSYTQQSDSRLPSSSSERWPSSERRPVADPRVEPNTGPRQRLQCKTGTLSKESVPTGEQEVDHLEGIHASDGQDCVAQCCSLGPLRCQYVWMIGRHCYAVACPEHPQLCQPMAVISKNGQRVDSLYVKMVYEGIEELPPSTPPPPYQHPEQNTTQPLDSSEHEGETPTHLDDEPDDISESSNETTTESTPTEALQTEPTTHADGTKPTQPHEPETNNTIVPVTYSATHTEAPTPTETPPTTAETPPTTAETPPTTAETTPPATTPTTKETAPPTPPPTIAVQVSSPDEVTLPREEVRLFAGTWPTPAHAEDYSYKWEEVSGPSRGILDGKNEQVAILTQLAPGNYILKVTVESRLDDSYGFRFVNLTVHPEPRVNQPPTAIIYPQSDVVKLPQTSLVILDASRSEDDMGSDQLSYHWEEVKGPVRSDFTSDSISLKLSDLKEGDYQFKLTVTDGDGAKSEAFADIKVEPEVDYPPEANAGQWVVIHLPNQEVTLNGNKSTDDKGIAEYSWKFNGDERLDLQGSQTPTLHVSGLTLGSYVFELTVTDTVGQTDSATVGVAVQDEEWIPPVAIAGGNVSVAFPKTSAVLDGSESHDDYKDYTFSWEQISGPTDIQLSGDTTNKLSVSGLHIDAAVGSPTAYQFRLVVTDYHGLNGSDIATIFYSKDVEHPPSVNAGPDVTITLPQNTAILNGSASYDDFGISSYQWTRSDSSPAAGEPVLGSEARPVLILSNLINGTYNFSLAVTNNKGKVARDNVTLTVLPNPLEQFVIQVYLDAEISTFSQDDQNDFSKVLSLLLKESDTESYTVTFQGVRSHGPHIMVEFYARDSKGELLNATTAYDKLTEKGQDFTLMSFHIVMVEMKECQLSCSNHGTCNPRTKKCQCDTFWMENPFKAHFNRRESNCEWSGFYVVLVVLGIVLVLVFFLWLCCCCCLRKRRRSRTKRRMRYAILDHREPDEQLQMLPRDTSGYQQTSLMVSESETEEEILFDSSRKSNSSPALRNGKPGKRLGSLANGIIPK